MSNNTTNINFNINININGIGPAAFPLYKWVRSVVKRKDSALTETENSNQKAPGVSGVNYFEARKLGDLSYYSEASIFKSGV